MNAVNKCWMMSLALAITFLAVGCSEDSTNDSDTGADACSLTEGECTGRGKDFDAATCACVDKPGTVGDCSEPDALCDANLAQPNGFLCVKLAQPDASGKTGLCAQSCNSFFDDNCPVGNVCFPKALFDTAKDICIPAGNLTEGAECTSILDSQTGGSPCQQGLMCLGGVCDSPNCSPLTTAKSCEVANEQCDGVDFTLTAGGVVRTDVGFCYQPCDGFSANTCDSGEWCQPGFQKEAGKFPGSCTQGGGSKAPGATCTASSECQDGSICIGTGNNTSECAQLCDATKVSADGPGGCAADQGCAPLSNEDETFDVGYCTESCSFDEGDGCSKPTDACVPSEVGTLFDLNFDSCIPFATNDFYSNCTTAEFSFCNPLGLCMNEPITGYAGNVCHKLCRISEGALGSTDHKDCGGNNDTVCAGRFNTAVLPVGLCIPTNCDPTVADSGACQADEACRGVSSDNSKAGRCQKTCNFDDAASTCAGDTQCYPGELLGFLGGNVTLTNDFCDNQKPAAATKWPLNPGEDCVAAKIEAGQSCGTFSMCLEVDQAASGVRCYEFCRASEKALNSTNHPDCNSPTQTCSAAFTGVTSFGICQGN